VLLGRVIDPLPGIVPLRGVSTDGRARLRCVVTLRLSVGVNCDFFSSPITFRLYVLGFSRYSVVATMNATLATNPPVSAPRRPAVPNSILGVLIFIITEIMFFSGLISAFVIGRSAAGKMLWPPPGQPRLPIETTGFNTAVLLASAAVLFLANRKYREDKPKAGKMLALAMALGAFFVLAQGREWVALIAQGLRLTTSTHGSFFYVIVGCHAAHAIAAICALAWAFTRIRQDRLSSETFTAVSLFWYFVAGVWPMLYYQVYLS